MATFARIDIQTSSLVSTRSPSRRKSKPGHDVREDQSTHIRSVARATETTVRSNSSSVHLVRIGRLPQRRPTPRDVAGPLIHARCRSVSAAFRTVPVERPSNERRRFTTWTDGESLPGHAQPPPAGLLPEATLYSRHAPDRPSQRHRHAPSPAMRRAMHEAELGDDVFGDDPTVNALEERAAELLGKEAGLFVGSGTRATSSPRWPTCPAARRRSPAREHHLVIDEAAGHAVIVGASIRALEDRPDGTIDPARSKPPSATRTTPTSRSPASSPSRTRTPIRWASR